MSMRKLLALAATAAFLFAGRADAADTEVAVADSVKKQVLEEIESYVTSDAKLKGAFFIVDPRNDQVLKLTFDHVHQGVKKKGEGYIACVDFKDKAGKVYDIDVVVQVEDGGNEIAKVFVHKIEGKPVAAKPIPAK